VTLEVLSGSDDPLDVPRLLRGLTGERFDGDDPLALLASDLRPVVGVRRVGQVLVLLELLADRVEQDVADRVVGADPSVGRGRSLRPSAEPLARTRRDANLRIGAVTRTSRRYSKEVTGVERR
jgi:hypothetical protein